MVDRVEGDGGGGGETGKERGGAEAYTPRFLVFYLVCFGRRGKII